MDFFTEEHLSIFGGLVVVSTAVYVGVRYAWSVAMSRTIAVYRSNSEAQRALIDTKEEIIRANESKISDLAKSIELLKTELILTERSFQTKIDELTHRIDTLSDENSSYRTSRIRLEDRLHSFHEALVYCQDTCPQQCELSKHIHKQIDHILKTGDI